MKLLYKILLIFGVVTLSTQMEEIKTPLPDTTPDIGRIMITRVNSSFVLLGTFEHEYLMAPGQTEAKQTYPKANCEIGSICPQIISSQSNQSSQRITFLKEAGKMNGDILILDLEKNVEKSYTSKCYSIQGIRQIGDKEFIVLCTTTQNYAVVPGDMIIEKYNVETGYVSEAYKFPDTLNAVGAFYLASKQLLIFDIPSKDSIPRAVFMDTKDFKVAAEVSLSGAFDAGTDNFGMYDIIELKDQNVIGCYYSKGIKCFSGKYSQNQFTITEKATEMLDCIYNKNFYKVSKVNDNVGIVKCESRTLTRYISLQMFDMNLKKKGGEMKLFSFNYYGYDFVPLSEYQILFVMLKADGTKAQYVQSIFNYPYCKDVTCSTSTSKSYSLNNLFKKEITNDEKTEKVKEIKITQLPAKGSITTKNGQNAVLNKVYSISDLEFKSSEEGEITFTFVAMETKDLAKEIESDPCSAKMKVVADAPTPPPQPEEPPQSGCYKTCLTCTKMGEEMQHNCITCKSGLEFTTGNDLGNCLEPKKIPPNLSQVAQFAPILKDLENSTHIKEISIKDGYSLYYYKTTTNITRNDIPYVMLGECEKELRARFGMADTESIYIGMLLQDNKTSGFEFEVYRNKDNKLEKLDISVCKNDIEKNYPINKDHNQFSLIYSLLNSDASALLKKKEFNNLYDSKANLYKDPCLEFEVGDIDTEMDERKEMYSEEIQFCPSDCNYTTHSASIKMVKCQCKPSQYETPVSYHEAFGKNPRHGFSIFPCNNLFKRYPGKGFLHWFIFIIIIGSAASFVYALVFFNKFHSALPSPSRKSPSEDPQNENSIVTACKNFGKPSQILNLKDNSAEKGERGEKEIIIESIKTMDDNYEPVKRESSGKIIRVSNKLNYSSILQDIQHQIKEKVLFGSIFTNMNLYYLVPMRIILHLMILSFMIYLNCFFYKENPNKTAFRGGHAFASSLISFIFYKVGFFLITKFCHEKGKLRLALIIETSICEILNFIFWYYVFLFGVIYTEYEGYIVLLTILTIIFFLFVQLLFATGLAILRGFGTKTNSQLICKICNILDLIV